MHIMFPCTICGEQGSYWAQKTNGAAAAFYASNAVKALGPSCSEKWRDAKHVMQDATHQAYTHQCMVFTLQGKCVGVLHN